ncbi:polysaccharide deacetylase family protein [Parapedobacter sp. 10938]|uniref:polysaccharide deacetylase family protein n=1 Tax=Parapedobacter flavus TaxID=3110225 RepID=UPI002DB9E610|nr:polysaccharide deacetylase family protein [Parapedobacter sp. 10938]MEC3881145.1 polysaccharide deacetylase family protein [Parapedobacter sp. 10938]
MAAITRGAFHIQANFFLKATHEGDARDQQIALTFDDGPHPVYTPQVLELLRQHHAKATFFCTGKNVGQHPDVVKQIHDAGHTVGNHSYSHAQTIDFHGKNSWLNELRQTDAVIEQAIGRRPRFFRPPYGVTTPHLANAIRTSGHRTIGWRVRPYDTLEHRSPAQIVHTVIKKVKPGAIILLHDTHDRIVPVLEQLLPKLCQRGYTLVTVAQLIDQDAYTET